MRNPLKTDRSAGLGLFLARLPMGLFFLLAGCAKISGGMNRFVAQYSGNVPRWAPPGYGNYYLHAVPFLEIAVGVLVTVGLLTRLFSLIGAVMILTFIIGVTGLRNPAPFNPNCIYLGLMLMLFLVGPGKMSLDYLLFGKGRRTVAPAP